MAVKDHREIGQELDLFSFSDKTPGFVYWHPKGTLLFDLMVSDIKKRLAKFDYQEIKTPAVMNVATLKETGHYDNYREKLFFIGHQDEMENPKWALKPMNCPGSIVIFKDKMRSYKEMPLRFSEIGTVYRYEQAGEIGGLLRVRALTIDDAHIYCRENQIEEEIVSLIDFVYETYQRYGFSKVKIELSTRPEKSIGTDEQWQRAEAGLANALKKKNLEYKENPGEGAFYGPKIDFHIEDSQNRSWQLGTIQLDFALPPRMGINYIDEKGAKQSPIIIHRAILGSVERFLAVFLEHTQGSLPLWLAPVQIAILPISEKSFDYAKKIKKEITGSGYRTEVDTVNETIGKKIRSWELQKTPYILVVGEDEEKTGQVAVRSHQKGDQGKIDIKEFINQIKNELEG